MPRGRRQPEPPKLTPIAGRVPPNNLEAEAAVLSACMLAPQKIDLVAGVVSPKSFYSSNNGLLFGVLLELRAENQPIDTVTISHRLAGMNRLAQIGGTAQIATLIDATPAVSHVLEHARIVADLYRRRTFNNLCHVALARGYDSDAPEGLEADTIRQLTDLVQTQRKEGAIASSWKKLNPAYLRVPPAPRRWLLRHPTKGGADCAPQDGDGMVPMGKAGLLSAEGGAGKTLALCQLAIAVVTGKRWFGHFDIGRDAQGGRVLLALAEEDEEEMHRRLFAVAQADGLSDSEIERCVECIVVLPLMGKPVALIDVDDDGMVAETDELRDIRRRLHEVRVRACTRCHAMGSADICHCGATMPAFHGWSLIVLDPLSRWSGADTEKDNKAATRFVQAVESLTEAPGFPSVLVAHHSSKGARKEGKADARGVTAITDGFRWTGEMRSLDSEVLFKQAKSNYSRPWKGEELAVIRAEALGGVLRVATPEEKARDEHFEEEREADREHRVERDLESKMDAACARVIDALRRCKDAPRSVDAIAAVAGGRKTMTRAAAQKLMASGEIIKVGAGYVVAADQVINGDDRRSGESSQGPRNDGNGSSQLGLLNGL